jgi:hypothetical protein
MYVCVRACVMFITAYIRGVLHNRCVLMQLSLLHVTNLFVLFTCLQLASLSTVRQNCRKEVIKLYYTLAFQSTKFNSFGLPQTVHCIQYKLNLEWMFENGNVLLNTLTSGHVERRDCSPMRCWRVTHSYVFLHDALHMRLSADVIHLGREHAILTWRVNVARNIVY